MMKNVYCIVYKHDINNVKSDINNVKSTNATGRRQITEILGSLAKVKPSTRV